MNNKNNYIIDNIHGFVRISALEKQLISTSAFNRLHDIYQNSAIYLTFPCTRTKRFEHSIGTMYLTGTMFTNAISNSNQIVHNVFFADFNEIFSRIIDCLDEKDYLEDLSIRTFTQDILVESAIEADPFYSFNIPNNLKASERNSYVFIFQTLRIAALLHDIGHLPFSHITELAMTEIFESLDSNDSAKPKNRRQIEVEEIRNEYLGKKKDERKKKALHEQIGERLTDYIFKGITKESNLDNHFAFICVCFEFTKMILNANTSGLKLSFLSSLHSIIDGSMDSDRLDYVVRDLLNSGVSNEIINYQRLLSDYRLIDLTLTQQNIKKKTIRIYAFAPNIKCLDIIEEFFFKRQKLYNEVINHHRSAKLNMLLRESIIGLGLIYLNNDSENDYTVDQKNTISSEINGLWSVLKSDFTSSSEIPLMQWDDSWLITILKRNLILLKDRDSSLFLRLDELLTNKKHFNSLIKRQNDYVIIDKAYTRALLNKMDIIHLLLQDYDNSLALFKDVEDKDRLTSLRDSLSMIINLVDENNKLISSTNEDNSCLVQQCILNRRTEISQSINGAIKHLKCHDVTLNDRKIPYSRFDIIMTVDKHAIENFYIYENRSSNKIHVTEFKHASRIESFFREQRLSSPPFYVITVENFSNDEKVTFLEEIGSFLAADQIHYFEESLFNMMNRK